MPRVYARTSRRTGVSFGPVGLLILATGAVTLAAAAGMLVLVLVLTTVAAAAVLGRSRVLGVTSALERLQARRQQTRRPRMAPPTGPPPRATPLVRTQSTPSAPPPPTATNHG